MALLLCGAIGNTTTLSAQSSKSTPSRITISTGIGLLPTYTKASENNGMLPVSFMLGYDLTKNFSLGAFFGFSSTTSSSKDFIDNGGSFVTNKTKVFGLRTEVKKPFSEKVAGYGGVMLGVHHADVKEYQNQTKALVVRPEGGPTPFNPNAKKGRLAYAAYMGATYKVAKRVSLYGELGYGISIANIGVTVRI